MFYVINLSKPRKYLVQKYDDIMIDLRLHPNKVEMLKKYAITTLIIGGSILAWLNADSAVYACVNGENGYHEALEYLVSNKHYPREYAESILKNFSTEDLKELYKNIDGDKAFCKGIEKLSRNWYNLTHPEEYIKNVISRLGAGAKEVFDYLK